MEIAVKTAVAERANVIIMTSSLLRSTFQALAKENPSIKFIQFDSPTGLTANYGSYFGNYHQAWYLGGATTAQFYYSNPKLASSFINGKACIGVIAPLPSAQQVVAQINAFALGVTSITPPMGKSLEMKIRWTNTFAPAEADFKADVDALLGAGCNVIVNRLGTNGASEYIASRAKTDGRAFYTMVRDNFDACNKGTPELKKACLGAPYWNFGPAYRRLILSIQSGTYDSLKPIEENLQATLASTMFAFQANSEANIPELGFVDEVGFIGPKRADVVTPDATKDLTFSKITRDNARWWDSFGTSPKTELPPEYADDATFRDIYKACWFHSLITEQNRGSGLVASSLDPFSKVCAAGRIERSPAK
jgi:hypothetical protein